MNNKAAPLGLEIENSRKDILLLKQDFERKEQNYKAEIKILNEQIKSLQERLFGRKTEKQHRDDGQLSLFDISEPPAPPRSAENHCYLPYP
ncbi:MAG: transposase [Desulfobacterales bacterium]|nr:transposase [Desulfobacterales bacterium]